jgi:hypothetical protein
LATVTLLPTTSISIILHGGPLIKHPLVAVMPLSAFVTLTVKLLVGLFERDF